VPYWRRPLVGESGVVGIAAGGSAEYSVGRSLCCFFACNIRYTSVVSFFGYLFWCIYIIPMLFLCTRRFSFDRVSGDVSGITNNHSSSKLASCEDQSEIYSATGDHSIGVRYLEHGCHCFHDTYRRNEGPRSQCSTLGKDIKGFLGVALCKTAVLLFP
jgi:hypothetical protein